MMVCVLCGMSLEGRRPQSRYCCDAHRAEANRMKAILSGSPAAPYPSLAHRIRAASKRTRASWWGLDIEPETEPTEGAGRGPSETERAFLRQVERLIAEGVLIDIAPDRRRRDPEDPTDG